MSWRGFESGSDNHDFRLWLGLPLPVQHAARVSLLMEATLVPSALELTIFQGPSLWSGLWKKLSLLSTVSPFAEFCPGRLGTRHRVNFYEVRAPHWLNSVISCKTTESCGRMQGKKGSQLLLTTYFLSEACCFLLSEAPCREIFAQTRVAHVDRTLTFL